MRPDYAVKGDVVERDDVKMAGPYDASGLAGRQSHLSPGDLDDHAAGKDLLEVRHSG